MTNFVNSVPEYRIRIIDADIVTKYIIRDVDKDFNTVNINEELSAQDIIAIKNVRFKKKGTTEPIPIVLIEKIGKTNLSEIKIDSSLK